jgi:hypothetical protein
MELRAGRVVKSGQQIGQRGPIAQWQANGELQPLGGWQPLQRAHSRDGSRHMSVKRPLLRRVSRKKRQKTNRDLRPNPWQIHDNFRP